MTSRDPGELAEWKRPVVPWRAYDCLCPLTQEADLRAATWRRAWADRPAVTGGSVRRPNVAPTAEESQLLVAYARSLLGKGLEAFLDSGERPYGMYQGGGSFRDPNDRLVTHNLEHDGRGVSGARRLPERVAADRAWAAYWTPRRYEQHNPGHQAHSPMPTPFSSDDTVADFRLTWEQVRKLMVAKREEAASEERQPRLF